MDKGGYRVHRSHRRRSGKGVRPALAGFDSAPRTPSLGLSGFADDLFEAFATPEKPEDLANPENLDDLLATAWQTVPVEVRGNAAALERARRHLLNLGLLVETQPRSGESSTYLVHRWTAEAIQRRSEPREIEAAHRRAARFSRRLARERRASPDLMLAALSEARFHHVRGRELDRAFWLMHLEYALLYVRCDWSRIHRVFEPVLEWGDRRIAAVGLLRMANASYFQGEHETAETLFSRMMELLEGEPAGVTKAEGLGMRGINDLSRGNPEEASRHFDAAEEIYQELHHSSGLANVMLARGDLLEQHGRAEEALEMYRAYLDVVGEGAPWVAIGSVRTQIARVLCELDRVREAEHDLRDVLKSAQSEGSPYVMYLALTGLAEVARLQDNPEEEVRRLRRALAAEEERGNSDGMAEASRLLGMVAERQERFEQAVWWHRRSFQLRERLGDRWGAAVCAFRAGIAEQEREHWSEAETWYLLCLDLVRADGNRLAEAMVLYRLGCTASSDERPEQARRWLEESLTALADEEDPPLRSAIHRQIGVVEQSLGESDEAFSRYMRAHEIAVEGDHRVSIALALEQVGRLAREQDEPVDAVKLFVRAGIQYILVDHVDEGKLAFYQAGLSRQALGSAHFRQVLEGELDTEREVTTVLECIAEVQEAVAREDRSEPAPGATGSGG